MNQEYHFNGNLRDEFNWRKRVVVTSIILIISTVFVLFTSDANSEKSSLGVSLLYNSIYSRIAQYSPQALSPAQYSVQIQGIDESPDFGILHFRNEVAH